MANDPAQVVVCCEIRSQTDGAHPHIGCGDGLEHTLRQTTEYLADQEHLDVHGEESNENELRDHEKSTENCLAITDPLGNEASQEKPNDFTDGSTIGQYRAP